MVDAFPPAGTVPGLVDELIKSTDRLIAQATMVDPVTAAILGLAKAELVAHKAVLDRNVVRFQRPVPHTQ